MNSDLTKQIIKKAKSIGYKINASSIVDEILLVHHGWKKIRGSLSEVCKVYGEDDYYYGFSALHFEGVGDLNFGVAIFIWQYEDCGEEGVIVSSSLEVDGRTISIDGENSITIDRINAQMHTPTDCVFFEFGPPISEFRSALMSNYNLWQR